MRLQAVLRVGIERLSVLCSMAARFNDESLHNRRLSDPTFSRGDYQYEHRNAEYYTFFQRDERAAW